MFWKISAQRNCLAKHLALKQRRPCIFASTCSDRKRLLAQAIREKARSSMEMCVGGHVFAQKSEGSPVVKVSTGKRVDLIT